MTPEADGTIAVSLWDHTIAMLTGEYGEHLVQDQIETSYAEFVDYRRSRQESLRKFMPEHTRRSAEAAKNLFDIGPRAKTFFFEAMTAEPSSEQELWMDYIIPREARKLALMNIIPLREVGISDGQVSLIYTRFEMSFF